MRILNDFLRSTFTTEVLSAESRLKEAIPTIDFESLWYLFRPGLDVYVQLSEDLHVCVISSVSKSFRMSSRSQQWDFEMWCSATDGRGIAHIPSLTSISQYSSYKEVTSLPICPVEIWDLFDGGTRRKSIMERS